MSDGPSESFNIAEAFLDVNLAAGRAGRPAVYCGDDVYSFADVAERSRRIGRVLRELGVEPEQRVLLVMQDSPDFVAAWFAVLRIGAVTCETYNYLPDADIRAHVEALRPKLIVADASTVERVRAAIRGLRHPAGVLVGGVSQSRLHEREHALDALAGELGDDCPVEPTVPDQAGFCLFSGGTTGRPKTVVHRHATARVVFENLQDLVGYGPDDRVLPIPKLFFGYARLYGVVCPFRVGAAAVLYPERSQPERILELIRRHRPTALVLVPTMMRNLLAMPSATREDFASVRVCTSSGEHLPAQLYTHWMERFGAAVVNFLSSTELGGVACLANGPGEQVPGSVGRARPGVEARVVDPDTGSEVEPGEIGVLQIRTDGAGLCYWEDVERSRETFLGGWVRHADLFRRDADGNHWFAGRHDDFVKVGGLFVSPSEIEACLEGHPEIAESAVLAVEEADGLMTTCAYVVPRDPARKGDAFAAAVRDYAKAQLGGHRFPRRVVFLDELPKTPQGKVHRRRLRERDPEREVDGAGR